MLPLREVTTGLSMVGAIENTGSPVPVSLVREVLKFPEEIEFGLSPYNVPVRGRLTEEPDTEFKVIAPPPVVAKFSAIEIVLVPLLVPVPPYCPAIGPAISAEPLKEAP